LFLGASLPPSCVYRGLLALSSHLLIDFSLLGGPPPPLCWADHSQCRSTDVFHFPPFHNSLIRSGPPLSSNFTWLTPTYERGAFPTPHRSLPPHLRLCFVFSFQPSLPMHSRLLLFLVSNTVPMPPNSAFLRLFFPARPCSLASPSIAPHAALTEPFQPWPSLSSPEPPSILPLPFPPLLLLILKRYVQFSIFL